MFAVSCRTSGVSFAVHTTTTSMPPCTTFFYLILATCICTSGAAPASKSRRIPISSYSRNSDFPFLVETFDEDTFNRTKELSGEIDKALKNWLVSLAGLRQFFQDPMSLPDMAFASSYDSYESVRLTDTTARGLANVTVNVNNVGVPKDDVTQVHIHIYMTLSRLEVLGNFTLTPASSNALKSGPFNFTAVDLVAVGLLKISQDENGYQKRTSPYLPIQHGDMNLHLEQVGVTLESDFLNYEIFDTIEPRLRDKFRLSFDLFADKLIDKVRLVDQNNGSPPDWENQIETDATEQPAPVKALIGPASVARSVPKSSYSPAVHNASTADVRGKADKAATLRLCEKIKRTLEPYGRGRGVVTIPGPSFFPDPMRLRDMTFSSRYDYGTANFMDVQLYGMSNFTVNVNWIGYFEDRMPVHMHMFLRMPRVQMLGNYTLLPFTSGEAKSGQFDFTATELVAYGVLTISEDEGGYRRSALRSDGVARECARLRLDDGRLGETDRDRFLGYDLYLAGQPHFGERVGQFFLHFGDKLIDQLNTIDGSNRVSSK